MLRYARNDGGGRLRRNRFRRIHLIAQQELRQALSACFGQHTQAADVAAVFVLDELVVAFAQRYGLWLWVPARVEPVIGPAKGRTRWLGRDDDLF